MSSRASVSNGSILFDGEGLSDADFHKIVRIAGREAGLMIPDSKRNMVQSRLSRRLRFLNRTSVADYLEHVETSGSRDEMQAFISVLTTNVSSFFREKHHFTTLERDVFPGLIKRAARGEKIRLWSAGCSSGQEPYSLAMALLRMDPDVNRKDIRILATDIDAAILRQAGAAEFSGPEAASLDPIDRSRFFRASPERPGHFVVNRGVRDLVGFRALNLHEPWPMKARFDVVLCRNVVIYFDNTTQKALWPRFRSSLAPQGWLFLGHSERIANPAAFGFETAGVTTYRAMNSTLTQTKDRIGPQRCH